MASGSTGAPGGPVPDPGGQAEYPNVRVTVDNMMDIITTLRTQMAVLMEDPDDFMNRRRTTDSPGPAVRARSQDHEIEVDRTRMREIEDNVRDNAGRLDQLVARMADLEARMNNQEACLSFYSGELTTDRADIARIGNDLNDLRNNTSSSRATITGARDRTVVTAVRGFDKLKAYTGASPQWKEWRYKATTWLVQTSSSFESLMTKLDASEVEPTEPEVGRNMVVGPAEITMEEGWCSEQLYQLMVQKCEGPALDIIRNQNTKGKARGLVAWYRTLREAEGQVPTKRSEITEKVFHPDRKAVAAKDVVATIEAYEADIREYQNLTGSTMDNTIKVLSLKKMLPDVIRERLDTLDVQDYLLAKEYAIKQARILKKLSLIHI